MIYGFYQLNDITIKVYYQCIYTKNTLPMILISKCLYNDFNIKYTANDFTIKILCQRFYYKNTLPTILL